MGQNGKVTVWHAWHWHGKCLFPLRKYCPVGNFTAFPYTIIILVSLFKGICSMYQVGWLLQNSFSELSIKWKMAELKWNRCSAGDFVFVRVTCTYVVVCFSSSSPSYFRSMWKAFWHKSVSDMRLDTFSCITLLPSHAYLASIHWGELIDEEMLLKESPRQWTHQRWTGLTNSSGLCAPWPKASELVSHDDGKHWLDAQKFILFCFNAFQRDWGWLIL